MIILKKGNLQSLVNKGINSFMKGVVVWWYVEFVVKANHSKLVFTSTVCYDDMN